MVFKYDGPTPFVNIRTNLIPDSGEKVVVSGFSRTALGCNSIRGSQSGWAQTRIFNK